MKIASLVAGAIGICLLIFSGLSPSVPSLNPEVEAELEKLRSEQIAMREQIAAAGEEAAKDLKAKQEDIQKRLNELETSNINAMAALESRKKLFWWSGAIVTLLGGALFFVQRMMEQA